MTPHGPTDTENSSGDKELLKLTRVRNAVILPDGTKKEPLGSGVITGLLGVGGMANVYRIWNSQLEVSRAVKLLHPNYTEEARQRFQTEIKITAKLHHRNIIEIHAVGHWNSLPYIEMELIEGDTLEKIINERGALPVNVCTAVAIMIGRALWYAHNQEYAIYGTTYHGVIHRDLKPSNIMANGDGVVKLMDFGIARPTDASIHTTDGAILGTMQYLSPEQLDGKEPDIRTDIYSLGTILYEFITGIKAFPENNISKLMLNKIKNDFRPLDQFDVKIPARLRRLVHRCMMYDRDKRVPNAQAFLNELGRIHRSLCGDSPEQVMREYLKEQEVVHTVVATRRHIPLKVLVVGGLLLVMSLMLWSGRMLVPPKSEEPVTVSEILQVTQQETTESKNGSGETVPRETPSDEDAGKTSHASHQAKADALPASIKPKPAEPQAKSPIELLQEKYGTENLLDIFCKEVERRSWTGALKVYDALPPSEAGSPRAVVYKTRVLRALKKTAELKNLIAKSGIEDGELYLVQAELALQSNDLESVVRFLKSSERTPGAFMENSALRLERLHIEALSAMHRFDLEQSETSRRFALDRWFEVKSELRTSPDHAWYREAETQMQHLTGR